MYTKSVIRNARIKAHTITNVVRDAYTYGLQSSKHLFSLFGLLFPIFVLNLNLHALILACILLELEVF
jgi:hypothetical protein